MPWMRSGWDVLFHPFVISGNSEQVSFLGTSVGSGMVVVAVCWKVRGETEWEIKNQELHTSNLFMLTHQGNKLIKGI